MNAENKYGKEIVDHRRSEFVAQTGEAMLVESPEAALSSQAKLTAAGPTKTLTEEIYR